MSRLDDLKCAIGQTVYFSTPAYGIGIREPLIYSGTLEQVDDVTCVVTWNECICLYHHDDTLPCAFPVRERLSIFRVQTHPPRVYAFA